MERRLKRLKVKGRDILYTATYRETLTSSGLQLQVAYWLAMTQVAQRK